MTEIQTVPSGQTIVTEGDASDGKAYFIEQGSVMVERKGKEITTLRE
jgi:CRP-like cAMP-binding protein